MNLYKNSLKNSAGYTKQNQQLLLRMVTSYSVFLIIILFLSLYSYFTTTNNMRKTYEQTTQSVMMNNVTLFEKDLNIMEVYCRQLLQNPAFRTLLTKSADYSELSEIGNAVSDSLAIDVYPESLLPIKEVFCYLKKSDYIINPSFFISGERYYNWIKHYDENNYVNWMEALTNEENYYRFLPMDSYAINSENSYYMYIINMDDLYYLQADAVVCFVLEKNEILAMFNCLNESPEYGSLLVMDNFHSPILQTGRIYEQQLVHADDFLQLHYKNGVISYPIRHNSTTYNLSVGTYLSKYENYTYYYTFPSFSESTQLPRKTVFFLAIIAIISIAAGWLILFFSRRNVAPIIELGNELEGAMEAQTHLQEVVDNQRPIICTSYVRQLLLGMVTTEEELHYIRSYLKLTDGPGYYNGLYIVAYNNTSEDGSVDHTNLHSPEKFNAIIQNALHNFFGDPLYCFQPADRTFGILLSCKAEEENNFIFRNHEIVVQLHNFLLDTYGIWLFAGIGKNTDVLMNVWESYQQAVEAASYISKNYFFFPYEFIKKDSRAFYYPPEISTKLIHFITTGNTAQVLELFNLIHQENIEERSLPVHILKFLLSDIRNTLLKARFALPDNTPEEVCQSLDDRFKEHMTFKLCEDIALSLCKLFATPEEDNNLISTIEKYIQQNYNDAAMGLNKIADEFQISETYFSHMFKEKMGVNFSTYLENLRMNEAARLIKETDISLNELYISVGYNNVNTFRRAFKKTFGVTPSALRDGK